MNDRSVIYNNAGVYMVSQGNLPAANDLFTAARTTLPTNPRSMNTFLDPTIVRAELHLANGLGHGSLPTVLSRQQHNNNTSMPLTTTAPTAAPTPDYFIMRHPFAIPPSLTSPHLRHVIVLFNLGLVHQLSDDATMSTSLHVAQLYHMASAVLADVEDSHLTLLLAIALLNNVGVWCHSTGDTEAAHSCMEQLTVLLMEEEEERVLLPEMQQGVSSNVYSILGTINPVVSPAA